jgi:two-component system, LuxR family, response regulator FixJ
MAELRTVYVVDDDEAVRESTALYLEAHALTVRTFASAREFLDAAPAVAAGCVVTDMRMPGMDGLELLRRLREQNLPLGVVVMTAHGEVPLAVQALKAGAVDFIEKPFAGEILLEAVETALRSIEQTHQKDADVAAFHEHIGSLTPREREVMGQLVAGHPNKVIAHNLGMSPRTVEVHRARVMEKMRVRSVSSLVRIAVSADFG